MTARTKVFHNPAFVKFDWIWFLSSMVRLRRFNILIKLYYNCEVFGHHLADSTRKYLLCCWLAGLCVACSWSPGLSAISETKQNDYNKSSTTKSCVQVMLECMEIHECDAAVFCATIYLKIYIHSIHSPTMWKQQFMRSSSIVTADWALHNPAALRLFSLESTHHSPWSCQAFSGPLRLACDSVLNP